MVMLAPGSGCKYRLSLAERSDCTETMINQLLADSYRNPVSNWQVKTSSGLPLILHYGELYNYFILQCNNNRNKGHDKCNALESFRNHSPSSPAPRSMEKLFAMKLVPGAKKVGDRCPRRIGDGRWSEQSGRIIIPSAGGVQYSVL